MNRVMNNQSPITKLQLITNIQYPITNWNILHLVVRSLIIGYYLVIGAWLLVISAIGIKVFI